MFQALTRFARFFSRARVEARRKIRKFPIHGSSPARKMAGPHRTHSEDFPLVVQLAEWHARYNVAHFDGKLKALPIGISRRMRSRLGHYSPGNEAGRPAEIVISRRHFRRHGWDETLQTLLHEMVHQWQDESGQEIDHGREFRAKARAVGVAPQATRRIA